MASHQKVAVYASLVCFVTYSCIFSFRKAFNVAPFAGYELWGVSYKVVLVITQVAGYMTSKFYGIRFIAEMQRNNRERLILLLVCISLFAWLLFGLVPPPYNFWCLFINGFPLGLLWGVVFSYVEGRRATDFIGAMLAVSFIFGSGFAKSVAEAVMQRAGITEYWMPFTVGLIFLPPLVVCLQLLKRIPAPDKEDEKMRTVRVPMSAEKRRELVRAFFPGILLLTCTYIMVTILREVRDSFMADMWRESGQPLAISSFAQTESIIALLILILIALMVWVKKNYYAFQLSQLIMVLGFILSGVTTWQFLQGKLDMFWWMTWVGCGLYMVYIPFNSNLFDRFIAAFHFTGNAGFLIYIADSFGYLGSVAVLLSRSFLKLEVKWLPFYTTIVLGFAAAGIVLCLLSLAYFHRKHQAQGDVQ